MSSHAAAPTIGIEASSILKQRTGIGHYTFQLLRHLAALDGASRYRVFTNSLKDRPAEPPYAGAANFSGVHSRIPGKLLLESWRRLAYPPVESFVGPVDLFHSTNNNPLPQRRGKRVLTVYDLYFLRRPERTDRWGGRYFHAVLPRRIHAWDRVITISDAMRRELEELLDVPPAKISVVPCGVDDYFRPAEPGSAEADADRLALPDRFLLAVGTLEPRKAYPDLLRAFRLLVDRRRDGLDLVIAGGDGLAGGEVRRAIDALGLAGRVHLPGYLDRAALRACYRRAAAFAMLSEYEGFGIPVLESMACGTPVLAADRTSLPEVVADAGLLVDPARPRAVADALDRLLDDRELAARLVARGRERARRFTWRQAARRTLAVYRELLS